MKKTKKMIINMYFHYNRFLAHGPRIIFAVLNNIEAGGLIEGGKLIKKPKVKVISSK